MISLSQTDITTINEKAQLSIFTSNGRLVKQLKFKDSYIWDGTDSKGIKLPVGIYVVQVQGLKGTVKTKIILTK